MKDLRKPEVSKEVMDMVIHARDLCRSARSYGLYLPDLEDVTSDDFEQLEGEISRYGYELRLKITHSTESWVVEVFTLRHKRVCVVNSRGQTVEFQKPFDAIAEGDTVSVEGELELIIDRVKGE
jgi:hypothetical protein